MFHLILVYFTSSCSELIVAVSCLNAQNELTNVCHEKAPLATR